MLNRIDDHLITDKNGAEPGEDKQGYNRGAKSIETFTRRSRQELCPDAKAEPA